MPSIEHIDVSIDFVDVKMDFLALLDGTLGAPEIDLSRERLHSVFKDLSRPTVNSGWAGGSANDTRDWITNGYAAPGMGNLKALSAAPRKRTRWREEGDALDLARAWSGDPTPFSTRESGTKQGIRIEAEMYFSAAANIQMISDYGQWLAQIASGYAANGHDLEINAIYTTERMWRKSREQPNYKVSLKKFGQRTDYAAWSPLFAPTGYRHLIFSMWSLDAARRGLVTTSGYGPASPGHHRNWSVAFDTATNTLRIGAAYHDTGSFPRERMNALLKAAAM